MSREPKDKKKNAPAPPSDALARREFIKMCALGAAGIGGMAWLRGAGAPGVEAIWRAAARRWPGLATFDAADLIADALGLGPSLALIGEARAQDVASAPAVFRVFYATSHDIRNELCLTDYGNVYNPFTTLNYGAAGQSLQGKVRKAPEPHSILNEWAYKLVTTGKIDGTTAFPGVADKPALTSQELAKLSVIAAVGMTGSEGIHQRAAIKRVGTLEYAVLQSFPNISPVGGVAIGLPVVDAAGGVVDPGRTLGEFAATIDVPDTYMSRAATADNPVRALDGLVGDKRVREARDRMLDAHNALLTQLTAIKGYATLAGTSFNTYGARNMQGLASMLMFSGLFEAGLAKVGAVGMPSFDFHATDALRMPNGQLGNMLTESSQALAGVFHIAKAAFAAQKDAIVHFTTCSNRNQTWVNDDSHVSTVTFIIKGSPNSPFMDVPAQMTLLPDNMAQTYAEGPGSGAAPYSGADAVRLQLNGQLTVGRLEATLVEAVGKAVGKAPTASLETPAGKLI
jgi:hypothetical protein